MTATAASPSIEDRLAAMLNNGGADRLRAFLDALNAHCGGVMVADHCCGRDGEPLVLTVQQLMRHLIKTDHPRLIEQRGYRMHTPINVTVHDPESSGHGPALGRGPR